MSLQALASTSGQWDWGCHLFMPAATDLKPRALPLVADLVMATMVAILVSDFRHHWVEITAGP